MRTHSPLRLVADLVGIVPEYLDQTGAETRVTPDSTRTEILRRMGIDASRPELAREALDALEAREWERLLPPVRVARRADPEAGVVSLRVPEGTAGPVEWTVEVVPEHGDPYARRGAAAPEWNGSIQLALDELPPEGYHTLRVTVRFDDEERRAEQSLILVPDACPSVAEQTGRERVFGVIVNLYTVRSARNWGIGDVSDLARLLEWVGERGGDFVGVNPLHALRNTGGDVSPYSPVSRIFRNPIYLDVQAVPEMESCREARRLLESPDVARELDALRESRRVEYERVMRLKRRVLRVLHDAFRAGGRDGERGRAYRAYLEEQGEALTRFATFEALAEHLQDGDWHRWPEHFRDADSPEVAAFRAEREPEVDFHRWLQFELDRQLAAAAARGRRAGLGIGLYQDLAIGTSPGGADVWSERGLFIEGVSIGAPPDDYSATGQNWGLPPLNPHALRGDGYRYWISLVRASLRNAGALRIDHAVGLFRQFWIPEGMSGEEGAYLRFPADDLLGILALEARRGRATVVGEDLGTVPEEVPPALHERGVLSSKVLYFEREGDEFRAPAEYEAMALATANTHDMPTLAGFWRGRDIEIKREVGMIESDDAAEVQRRAREGERRALLRRLAREGLLERAEEPETQAELRGAVHAFLCRTPSAMVGFSLDDLVGEVEPVNLPGVRPDRFSSWTRRLSTPLEALRDDAEVRAAFRCSERGRA